METMHQEHPMFKLGNDDASILNLGQLRWFLNETCRSLPDSTPIKLSILAEGFVDPCVVVLADKESVELYSL